MNMNLIMTNPTITSSLLPPRNSIGQLLPNNDYININSSPHHHHHHNNNNNNQQQQQQQLLLLTQPQFVSSISPEIFAKICEYLTPIDIFKLSNVCKQYRSFLCTPSSTISQTIWRTSRMKFLTYPKLPPPQGMDEKKYIQITNYDKRCEFCGNCDPDSSRICWEFRVRCCDKCLLKRTKTFEELEETEETKLPIDVIVDILPCVWIRGGAFPVPVHRYYWIDNINSMSNEYDLMKGKGKDFTNWLSNKKDLHKKYMAEVSNYYLEDQKQWNETQKKYKNL